MTRYLRVRLDADTEAKLDRVVVATGRTPSELVRLAITTLPVAAGEGEPATEPVRWQDAVGRIAAHGNRSAGWEITSTTPTQAACLNGMGFRHTGAVEVLVEGGAS